MKITNGQRQNLSFQRWRDELVLGIVNKGPSDNCERKQHSGEAMMLEHCLHESLTEF